jgi:phosphohistidine phosphatase
MRLLFIRHAIAETAENWSGNDADRPLTVEGKHRFVQVTARLAEFQPRPAAILTSPLLRARATADIAAKAWGDVKPIVIDALIEGDWAGIRAALAAYPDDATVALVGHENWISILTAQLLGAKSNRTFPYRKGGVALIEMKELAAGQGSLLWFIPPRILRKK